MAHSAGDSVSALIAERNIDTATVTANWRNSSPEMPGMKATGTNTESSTSVIAMIGAKICPIAILVASRGRQFGMVFHHLLDRLDHDDRIVHDDADGQHDRQQRDGVGGIADRVQHDERADQADRNRDRRDQRGAQVAQEQVDDEHHKDERLDQRLLHLVDRGGDEGRRVVGDLPGQIVREIMRRIRHRPA